MNRMALASFPEAPEDFPAQIELLRAAGFAGIQFAAWATETELAVCRQLSIGVSGSCRINAPNEAAEYAARFAAEEYECATVHLGWGLEDDVECFGLIESVLSASAKQGIPLYIETHRATICQDMWRTVGFIRRFPEMRFNGDFSHWYTGQEMVYGGFDKKLAFIQPVLERVRYLHGRVANPGCIQVPVVPSVTYTRHFEELWTACFRYYRTSADTTRPIYFTPELLGPEIYYARTFKGAEESDRWQESQALKQMAEHLYLCASSC